MRSLFALAFLLSLVSCGTTRVDGGQTAFDPQTYLGLDPENHVVYGQAVVKREQRDPEGITLDQLVHSKRGKIKKVGLVLFETQYQPSRSGLAAHGRNIYLSARGKQLLAEETWSFWDKRLRAQSGEEIAWVKRADLLKAKAFRAYGSEMDDLILSKKLKLSDEDVFWKNGGQSIDALSLVLPRGYQDVTILYIPAMDMMGGAKLVEHQKHWVNDICAELGLDAVLLVGSKAEWTQGGEDKRTHEKIPEQMKLSLEASLMYPLGTYLAAVEEVRGAGTTVQKKAAPFAYYSVRTEFPVTVTVGPEYENFATIQSNLLTPFETNYQALAELMIGRILTDIRSTQN